jgi:hypothetical protein
MQESSTQSAIPSLAEAKDALARLATEDAIQHLDAALRSLQSLAASLRTADGLPPSEKRQLERSLLRLKSELRDAGALAESGLAYCQDWALLLQPPAAYHANGAVTTESSHHHDFSLEG